MVSKEPSQMFICLDVVVLWHQIGRGVGRPRGSPKPKSFSDFPGWCFICLLYCCTSVTWALGCISRSVARSATWLPLDLNHLSWLRSLLLDGRLQAAVKKMLRFYQWIWGRRDAVFCLSWSFVIGQIWPIEWFLCNIGLNFLKPEVFVNTMLGP